jgi:hypothetical protein
VKERRAALDVALFLLFADDEAAGADMVEPTDISSESTSFS